MILIPAFIHSNASILFLLLFFLFRWAPALSSHSPPKSVHNSLEDRWAWISRLVALDGNDLDSIRIRWGRRGVGRRGHWHVELHIALDCSTMATWGRLEKKYKTNACVSNYVRVVSDQLWPDNTSKISAANWWKWIRQHLPASILTDPSGLNPFPPHLPFLEQRSYRLD